jgi:hypothetical protein
MGVISPSDIEFTPSALVARIVRGACEGDPVCMHGAIAATLQLHRSVAVFTPALELATEHSSACHDLVADAIQDHLDFAAARAHPS